MKLSEYQLIKKSDVAWMMRQIEAASERCERAMDITDCQQLDNTEEMEEAFTYPGATGYASGTFFNISMVLKYSEDGANVYIEDENV